LITIHAWSSSASLESSGWYFTVSFVVSEGTVWDVLAIYRSENGTTRVANTPDASCTLDSDNMCTFQTDHLSYFTAVASSTSNNPSGGGGGSVSKDNCPNGDTSASFYDGLCSPTETVGWEVQWDITGSPYSDELNNAYLYAFGIGITTMTPIQNANIYGYLIRSHMAKMMTNYAIKELGKTPNTWAACEFDDVANQTTELQLYIKYACQLGLMGQGITAFNPNGKVTRAEFGTVLSRALYGDEHNGWIPYYLLHLQALQTAGIMNNISDPFMLELRGRVMLMLMRAAK
jgi:hypothetical protein